MLTNFLTVLEQVVILFLLMALGFLFNKSGKLSRETCGKLSDIVGTRVAPCVIVKSFIRTYDPAQLRYLLYALGLSLLIHTVMAILSKVVLRHSDRKKRSVMVFASVFSNAGFIALPLAEALLGADGVFYSAAYIVIFNIFMWSFGILEMSGDRSMVTPKKLLVSPGIIGVVIGMLLFITSFRPPYAAMAVLEHVSALNVPLPMFIVGYYLAEADILHAFRNRELYFPMILRLLLFPALALGLLMLLRIDSTLSLTLLISVSAPVGATCSMFSEKFGGDTELSVKLVAVSTLLSILTMPVLVALAQSLL